MAHRTVTNQKGVIVFFCEPTPNSLNEPSSLKMALGFTHHITNINIKNNTIDPVTTFSIAM
jgi:hypothetical protein